MHALEGDGRPHRIHAEPARVLVLDSDAALRNVLTGCLLELGYEVWCAADAKEALRLAAKSMLKERAFHAAIIDISERSSASNLNAFTLIRLFDPDIRAIATSRWPHSAWYVNYEQFGFRAAIPKPWRFVELITMLRRVVSDDDNRRHSSVRVKCAATE